MKAHRPCLRQIQARALGRSAAASLLACLLGISLPLVAGAQPPIRVELESITVDPPGREAEILVRRHLPLQVGQVVDPDQLVQAREQLAATGLFRDVDIYTSPGSRPGAVNAIVAATPSHRFHLETGLGFEPPGGWFLSIIGVRRTGLFDRGGTARLSFRTGLRSSGLYGEMQVPGLLPNDFDLLFNIEGFDEVWTAYDGDQPYHQNVERGRVLVGARRRIGRDRNVVFRTGYSDASPSTRLQTYNDDPDIPAADLLPVSGGLLKFWSIESDLYQDRLDRLRPWQKGSWTGLTVRTAAPDRGPFFWGAEIDARTAIPVAGTRAAAFRFRAVTAGPGTPYFLRPIAGGTGSLRGFPEAALSGPLGARALWQASAEYRHPLAGKDPRRPRVIGTLFADVGDHWSARGDRFGLSASAGYGALIRIPWIETLNLEVAYPITDSPTKNSVAIGISLGRSF